MNQVFRLISDEIRERAIIAVKNAQEGMYVVLKQKSRSLDQNAKFHAICEQLQNSNIKINGRKFNKNEWKLLLISGHSMATLHEVPYFVGLEGEIVNLRESTANMSVSRMNSLIEYSEAFLQNNGAN